MNPSGSKSGLRTRVARLLPVFVAACPLVLGVIFQAAGPRPAFSKPAPPKPPLAFHQYMVNLGEVETQRVHQAVFWFTNTGDETLEVREVRTSCGCLSEQLEKKVVRAGETNDLTLFIRAANQVPGAKHYTATVVYGPVGNADVELERDIAFRLVLPEQTVTLNPRVLIMHQYKGNRVEHFVDVNDLRDQPLTVLDIECSEDFVTAELIPAHEIDPGSRRNGLRGQIRVIASDVPPGEHECVVRIRTSDEEFTTMTLPMRVYGPRSGKSPFVNPSNGVPANDQQIERVK